MKKINKKFILIIGGFLIAAAVLVFLIVKKESGPTPGGKGVLPTIFPTKNFIVASTEPASDATNVFPGEIEISFTSDTPISSPGDFSVYFSPPPEIKPKLTSSFPTKTVKHQVLGNLEKNTEYTVVVSNKHGESVAIWSFTTSGETPESTSLLEAEVQRNLQKNYYPLFDKTPFSNSNFTLYYTGRLTLLVQIKKDNVEAIKQEVFDWIQSKGVNPSTHTINYQNAF